MDTFRKLSTESEEGQVLASNDRLSSISSLPEYQSVELLIHNKFEMEMVNYFESIGLKVSDPREKEETYVEE